MIECKHKFRNGRCERYVYIDEELARLRAENEELRKALEPVVTIWRAEGRNPSVSLNRSIRLAAELLNRKEAE